MQEIEANYTAPTKTNDVTWIKPITKTTLWAIKALYNELPDKNRGHFGNLFTVLIFMEFAPYQPNGLPFSYDWEANWQS